jgi:hypothetical protein
VFSYGTIVSACSGSGAPVMIFIAVPGDSGCCAACPAGTSPTTGKITGRSPVADATSSAITAYPSIAELSKPGRLMPAMMSSHRLSPTESSSCWPNGGSSSIWPSR